jgi:hypothetical protein
MDSMLF